jgi:hypothetical protein
LEPIEPEPTDTSLWWVPLTVATRNRPNFRVTKPFHWLRAEPNLTIKQEDLNAESDDWIIFNIQQTGKGDSLSGRPDRYT